MDNKVDVAFDVTTLKIGDIVHYLTHENGKYFIEQGEVKEENIYKDGVDVCGDGWRQYVGKWFIEEVVRDEEVIFKSNNI